MEGHSATTRAARDFLLTRLLFHAEEAHFLYVILISPSLHFEDVLALINEPRTASRHSHGMCSGSCARAFGRRAVS